MNADEYEQFRQDQESYIKSGGTIKVYSVGTGKCKDETPYGNAPLAKLLCELTDCTLSWK
jgi:hypothetical protein